jgi:DNA-binding transcriptional regulator GbsR (MarR family)
MNAKDAAINRFVESWGSVGTIFGFTPSTARVSALLLVTGEELTLDQIAERLAISRGNASMCLKELRSWGVVRRVSRVGDRRDRFVRRENLWKMLLSIARERKRREFDPALTGALEAVRDLSTAPGAPSGERLAELEDFLATLERLGRQLLDNEAAAMSIVTLARSGLAPE